VWALPSNVKGGCIDEMYSGGDVFGIWEYFVGHDLKVGWI